MSQTRMIEARFAGACRAAVVALSLLCSGLVATAAHADARSQAKRMHDRLAGVPPSEAVLASMEARHRRGPIRPMPPIRRCSTARSTT